MAEPRLDQRAPAVRSDLARLLEEELQVATALAETLEQEARSLAGDPETLSRLTAKKLALVSGLEGLHDARCTLLQKLGLETDRRGMERLLEALGDTRLDDGWRRLQGVVTRCRERNLVNGALIEAGRQHARLALDLLRGQTAQAALYDAGGTRETTGSTRVIAKA